MLGTLDTLTDRQVAPSAYSTDINSPALFSSQYNSTLQFEKAETEPEIALTMRFLPLLALALPAATTAQQVPLWDNLKDLANQAKDYLSSAAAIPVDAGAAKVAEKAVQPLTWTNWHDVLQHSGEQKPYNPPEAWMVYVTGNRTCRGMCTRMDKAWNVSFRMHPA